MATISRFIGATRVAEITPAGGRLRSESVDLRPFRLRAGELVASALLDRVHGGEVVTGLSIQPSVRPSGAWQVTVVALAQRGPLRRREPARVIPALERSERA